ncbi:hypothetical protein AAG906_003288 [Vitis piasezkii]
MVIIMSKKMNVFRRIITSCKLGDAKTIGFQFTRKVVYIAIWLAKWLTTGGLGTVLLTLVGRKIFTNFLSSVMIHATQPFVHVGWWSSTIIRGDDWEVVHIPKHKFTVNVVRNLSQKTHWHIKTHFAIGHLDVNKINNIIADMHKENNTLGSSRVVNHHQACLAIPIRAVRKRIHVGDMEMENIPFLAIIYNKVSIHINLLTRTMLVLKSNFSIPSRGVTDFTLTVGNWQPNSSIWKFDRNGIADINVGSSKSSHVLASSHNSRQWVGSLMGSSLRDIQHNEL